jgi:hypothetical protein
MADEEVGAQGAEVDKSDFVGVSDSYANAANDTDVPRVAEEDKELYERFGEVPEPEKTSFYEGVHAQKDEENGESEEEPEPAQVTTTSAPSGAPVVPPKPPTPPSK